MADDGFYLMHRGWQDHPVFGNDPYSRRDAFEWLIAHASHTPRDVGVTGRVVRLQRGQLTYSLRYLARAWRWTEPKVRRWLAKLAELDMIELCSKTDAGTDAGQTVVTICNYETYQAMAQRTDAATGTGATQERRRSDANNKERKELKEKEPPVVPQGGPGADDGESKPKRNRKAAASRTCPPDWQPDPEVAASMGVDRVWAEHELAALRDWEFKAPKKDWTATWRNWLRRAVANGRPRALPHVNGKGSAHPGDTDWRAADAKEGALLAEWEAEVEPLLRGAPKSVKAEISAKARDLCAALETNPRHKQFVRAACLRLFGERIGKPQP